MAVTADVLIEYYLEWEDEEETFGSQYNESDDPLSETEYSEQAEFFE